MHDATLQNAGPKTGNMYVNRSIRHTNSLPARSKREACSSKHLREQSSSLVFCKQSEKTCLSAVGSRCSLTHRNTYTHTHTQRHIYRNAHARNLVGCPRRRPTRNVTVNLEQAPCNPIPHPTQPSALATQHPSTCKPANSPILKHNLETWITLFIST